MKTFKKMIKTFLAIIAGLLMPALIWVAFIAAMRRTHRVAAKMAPAFGGI